MECTPRLIGFKLPTASGIGLSRSNILCHRFTSGLSLKNGYEHRARTYCHICFTLFPKDPPLERLEAQSFFALRSWFQTLPLDRTL